MELKPVPCLKGYRYYEDNVNDELWSVRLETNADCNFLCKYCFASSTTADKDKIFPFEKLKQMIDQGVALGLRSVVFVGTGEPMLYPDFFDLLTYMKNRNVIPVLITNGSRITQKTAEYLLALNTSVLLKNDSMDKEVQNYLSGRKDAGKIISNALSCLKNAGYDNEEKLGLAMLVNKKNISEVPDWWRFCRKNKIFPNIAMLYPIGRADDHEDLWIEESSYLALKPVLAAIDKDEFGYQWDPQVPMPGIGCNTSFYSCYVTKENMIAPCVGMYDKLVENKGLSEMWKSESFLKFRNTYKQEGCCILNGNYCSMGFPGTNVDSHKP